MCKHYSNCQTGTRMEGSLKIKLLKMKIKTSEMKNKVVKLMAYLILQGVKTRELEDMAIENIQN